MKTRFFLVGIMALACVSIVNAYDDDDARDALRTTIESINGSLDELRSSVRSADNQNVKNLNKLRTYDEALSNRIEELQVTVSNLQAKVDRMGRKGNKTDELATPDKHGFAIASDDNSNVALWITIPIVMAICGFLFLVFRSRRSKSSAINHTRSEHNKCPRCGWEHDPGATVCKNPNCKTQF